MSVKPRLHAAPATVVSLAVILALAAAGLAAMSSPSTARSRGSRTQRRAAAAKQPQCGDTITADTTLHHNLVNCPNNGIIIDADNVTLNLNGHTIDGDGKPFAGCVSGEPCDPRGGRGGSRPRHREAWIGARVRHWTLPRPRPSPPRLARLGRKEQVFRHLLLSLRSLSSAKQRRKPDQGQRS